MALTLGASPIALLAFAALLGLGLGREVPAPTAAAVAAGALLFAALGVARLLGGRLPAFGVSLAAVAVAGLVLWPRYLPGEREEAAVRGLRFLGAPETVVAAAPGWLAWLGPEGTRRAAPRPLADWVAALPVAPAPDAAAAPEPPRAPPLLEREAADEWVQLRRTGERLLVSAHVESQHGADDVLFVLDTGAAITTLTRRAAEAVELELSDESPVVFLNGVGGRSEALLTVVEALWLGKERVGPLTVAVCDACLPGHGDGLLGIDVLDHFATEIDADALRLALRRSDASAPRDLVAPFLHVDARLRIRPQGEVRGDIELRSVAPLDVTDVRLMLACPQERFEFEVDHLPPHGTERLEISLPWGTPCREFQAYVGSARWG